MTTIRLLSFACLGAAGVAFGSLLPVASAQAQSAGCPMLIADSGLAWKQLDGPGFTFCRAVRADGSEAFAVTISRDSPFKPRRGDLLENTSIDGYDAAWYRSEVAGKPDALVRETLLRLAPDRVAHISLQASSQDQLADALRQVRSIDFRGKQLSSN